jgi:endonuclease/exonuclease/phosphatase (EEP) superfamily protein YafD
VALLFLFLAIVAAAGRNTVALVASLAVLAFGAVTVLQPRIGGASAAPVQAVRVASANVYGRNAVPREAIAALIAQDADVLIAVESPGGLTRLLQNVDREHTSWVVSDELVLGSRFPARELPLSQQLDPVRVMRVLVSRPGAPFVVYVVHDLNPLFDHDWNRQLAFDRAIRDAALRERLPTVLAGDFNLSDRTEGYRLLEGSLRDALRAGGGAGNTYEDGFWRVFLLRIDYVFTSPSMCAGDARTFDVPGSDHEGVFVATGSCP